MNLKNMSSFTESPRGDPRIIDLNNGHHQQLSQQQQQHNFNTLPVNHGYHHQEAVAAAGQAAGAAGQHVQQQQPHNTLPARVSGPTGRHFKPFDHRKMNPMAEIPENSHYGPPQQQAPVMYPHLQQQPQQMVVPAGAAHHPHPADMHNGLVAVKSNVHPNLPSNLRHTNVYSASGVPPSGPQHPKLVNPKILDHRDSANYSLGSSDSG